MKLKRALKLPSLLCAMLVGFCSSAFAWEVHIPHDQVNVAHEKNLALQRARQGILPQGLQEVYKIIEWGSIEGVLSVGTFNYRGRECVFYASSYTAYRKAQGEHAVDFYMQNCTIV